MKLTYRERNKIRRADALVFMLIVPLLLLAELPFLAVVQLILKNVENSEAIFKAIFYALSITLCLLYMVLMDFFTKEGSIGCKICKVRIEDARSLERKKPTKKQLLIRGLSRFLFIADVFLVFKSDTLSIVDILSKTKVVL
ncbi:MAG: RDD family protein [Clostridia bacterium]|nr:RDD family protein [Clostridia bacterium]